MAEPPGLHVEEAVSRPPPIQGVESATAGFVGQCARGPASGTPPLVTSYAEFTDLFGGAENLIVNGVRRANHLAHAARLFFENGGRRLYVARIGQQGEAHAHPAPRADAFIGGGTGASATGLAALAEVAEVAVVAAPGSAALASAAQRMLVREALIQHCELLRDRFAILAGQRGADIAGIRAVAAGHDSRNAALYFPWLRVPNPSRPGRYVTTSPEGAIAGIYARIDRDRGVHAAPANEAVQGILGLSRTVTAAQQDILNPEGVNCIRRFPGRGTLVRGARTLSRDPEWRYANVRRLLAFLESSIDRGTRWVVFEPNDEPLWARARATVEDFLSRMWRSGALAGTRQQDAFFVRCDRTTMTQDDLDNGRLVCLVGVAPLKPAEFVISRIGQWTADRPPS